MRVAFIDELTKIAREDKKISLLIAEGGFSVTENFEHEFPNRFYNMGIAEQSLISTAAGMALRNFKTVAYGMVPFLTMRCYEQIRMDVAYQNLPVIIAGIGPGMHYGTSGASHNTIEDIAIMRALPNIIVICASCEVDVRAALRLLVEKKKPAYISLGRLPKDYSIEYTYDDFQIGKAIRIREGEDVAIFACGVQVSVAAELSKLFERDGIGVRVYNMHTIKPIDKESICEAARECKYIFSLEERNIIGGLGGAIAEVLAEESYVPVKFKRLGINDQFQEYAGSQQWLLEQYDLSLDKLYRRIKLIMQS